VFEFADSVLAFAADATFFGFGAGGGGRLFAAVGKTVNQRQANNVVKPAQYAENTSNFTQSHTHKFTAHQVPD